MSNNSLLQFTKEQLEAEIKRREKQEAEERAQALAKKRELFRELLANEKAKQLFMMLLPEHSRTSCEIMSNIGRCSRCTAEYNLIHFEYDYSCCDNLMNMYLIS